jgi:hypothetical protein
MSVLAKRYRKGIITVMVKDYEENISQSEERET